MKACKKPSFDDTYSTCGRVALDAANVVYVSS